MRNQSIRALCMLAASSWMGGESDGRGKRTEVVRMGWMKELWVLMGR